MPSDWEIELAKLRDKERESRPSVAELSEQAQQNQEFESAVQAAAIALDLFMREHGEAARELIRRKSAGRDADRHGVVLGSTNRGPLTSNSNFMLTRDGLCEVPYSLSGYIKPCRARVVVEAYAATVGRDLAAIRDVVTFLEKQLGCLPQQKP